MMDIRATGLTAFTVVTLWICCIHAQDKEATSVAKVSEKTAESASGAKASEKEPATSASPKALDRASGPVDATEGAATKRVTGIGGVFIKAKDPVKLRAWYKARLGIDVQTWGGASFTGIPALAKTAWLVGDGSTFAPSNASFMVNYRVADLHGLLKLLREEGCQVLDKVEQSDFGIFGWVMDPEGNKVELWQPPAGR